MLKKFAPLLPLPVKAAATSISPVVARPTRKTTDEGETDDDSVHLYICKDPSPGHVRHGGITTGYFNLVDAAAQGLANTPSIPELGRGEPLPETTAKRFGRGYQIDLSGVTVHPASAAVAELGADALAVGDHVAFAPGRYRPGTPDGERLLGHELAHTVQQARGREAVQFSGSDGGTLEREAGDAVHRVLASEPAPRLSPAPSGVVQLHPSSGGSGLTPLPSGPGAPGNPFPDGAASATKEAADLAQLETTTNEGTSIKITANEATGPGWRYSLHSQVSGGGNRGTITTTTDLSLEYVPPFDIQGGPGLVLVNPEMPRPMPGEPGAPPLPIHLFYARTIDYVDAQGRKVTITVRSAVGFSEETWTSQTALRIAALDFAALRSMKGDAGGCSVFLQGSGPLQPYVALTDVAGVSLDIQLDHAEHGLGSSLFAITSREPPAFLDPRLSAGEQFTAIYAYLESADVLELQRRVELERKRREDLGILGRLLEDTGLDKILDAGTRAMESKINWMLQGISDLWNSLPAPVRGVLKAVGKFAVIVVAVVAGAFLAVELAAALGITITVTAAALAIGGLLLAVGYVGALRERQKESEKTGKGDTADTVFLALLDTLGLSTLIEAISDESLLSGKKYNRSPEDRWEAGTSGLLQMIAIALGIREIAKKPPTVELPPSVEEGAPLELPPESPGIELDPVEPRPLKPGPEIPRLEHTPPEPESAPPQMPPEPEPVPPQAPRIDLSRIDPALANKLLNADPGLAAGLSTFLDAHPSWRSSAADALAKLLVDGVTDPFKARLANKAMAHGDIPGMETWVVRTSRQSTMDNLLDMEVSLDDAIHLEASSPGVEMEVFYSEGEKLTYAEMKALQNAGKKFKDIDVETALERREWKRVRSTVDNTNKMMNQILEARLKFREAGLPRGADGKQNVGVVDFGANLRPPLDDPAFLRRQIEVRLSNDDIAKDHMDRLIVRFIDASGQPIELDIVVPTR